MGIFRTVLAIAVLSVGLALAIPAAMKGLHWTAVCFVLSGIASSLTVVFFEEVALDSGIVIVPLFALASTIAGFVCLVANNPLFNEQEASAQSEFLDMLPRMEIWSDGLTEDVLAIVRSARFACTIQQNADLMTLTVEAMKAVYFTPGLTLIDGVVGSSESKEPKRCLDYYFELRKMRPDLFVRFERNHPWLVAP